MFFPFFVLLAVLAQLASVLAGPVERRVDIQNPQNDPFYDPPADWEKASNGDVLRSRKVELALLELNKVKYNAAYEILYRTTGASEDVPSTTVTTMIVPYNAKKDQLVNYMTYIDSPGADCAPSYILRKGGKLGENLAMTYQQILFFSLLNEGYVLTVPDHQGPTRAFAAGRLEGRMSLDGIRASINFKPVGLSKKTKVGSFGYSGGAIASGWAAALQPSYAPEINAVGFAMGGTPSNITSTVENLNGGLFSGFGIAGMVGIAYTYDKIKNWLMPRLTDKGNDAVDFARSNCMINLLLRYPLSNIANSDDFIKGGHKGLMRNPVVQSVIHDIVLGYNKSETPKAPVYMFHASHDEVIPFDSAFKSGQDWAKHGADVYFEELTDITMGHVTSEFFNMPNVLFFFRDRMSGKSFPKGFNHKKTGNPLEDPGVPQKGLGSLIDSIKDIVGKKVGPADSIIKSEIKKHI